MRRAPILPVSAVVAALTAVALVGAALAFRPPDRPAVAVDRDEAATRELVLAFYAAANTAIAAGDLSAIGPLAAPALLAATAAASPDQDSPGLADRLLAIHATAPALQLRPHILAVDGDLVIVQVAIEGGDIPAFLGLDVIEHAAAWGSVDVVKIAGGRIIEHQGGAAGGVLDSLVAVPFDRPPESRRVLLVERITLAPGAEHLAGAVDGFRLLYVEAGTIAVAAIASASVVAPAMTLPAGERLIVPARVARTIRNTGQTPARLLDVSAATAAHALQPSAPVAPGLDAEADARVLAGGLTAAATGGPVVLAIGRATLPPGARLAWDETAGPVLLHIEDGTVGLDPSPGSAWVRDGPSGRHATLGDEPLAAGSGVLVVAGNAVELRAGSDAPATVLIMTVLPAA